MTVGESLINRAACKRLALRWARDNRKGCDFTRVSGKFLNDIETKLRLTITGSVSRHRTVGKTIIDVQ